MRRAKLAPGSVPPGSLPTSSSHLIPRCFVCDETIKSHRLSTSLLAGRTQYTHSPLPTKIGGYIGDEFVVVVTPQDALCKHCMALINTMDRLELELRQHRYTLTQHLKTKYKLDKFGSKQITKLEAAEVEENVDEPEVIEVSDEEWTPNKRQRTESVKNHRCTICNATYTNLSLFMAHLSRHKQVEKLKVTAAAIPKPVKLSINNIASHNSMQEISFKCGCCSESFYSKEKLALHMQLHTAPPTKAKPASVTTVRVNESISKTVTPGHQTALETTVQAPSLFEDIEQLSQHEVPQSGGVCSEEQKGRVCLLALLNNGVCSDISHRTPADTSSETTSQQITVNNVPNFSSASDQQTISITVSIPNVINGSQSGYSDFTISQESSLSNSCLDMPDLTDTSFQDVAEGNCQAVHDSNTLSHKTLSQRETLGNWSSSNSADALNESLLSLPLISERSVQDMPSLLDEDLIGAEESSTGNCVQLSNACQFREGGCISSITTTSSSEGSTNTKHCEVSNKEESASSSMKLQVTPSSQCEDSSDTVKNIAIVSVTSVQMSRDSYDAESEWFYSSSSKDNSAPDVKVGKEVNASIQELWLPDTNEMSVSDRNLLGENFNSNDFSLSSDPCVASRKMSAEDGPGTEETETRNKISSFV